MIKSKEIIIKKESTDTFYNMDEPCKHTKLKKQEKKIRGTWCWGKGEWGVIANSIGFLGGVLKIL